MNDQPQKPEGVGKQPESPQLWAYFTHDPRQLPDVFAERLDTPPAGTWEYNLTQDFAEGKMEAGIEQLQRISGALNTVMLTTPAESVSTASIQRHQVFIANHALNKLAQQTLTENAEQLGLDPANPLQSYREKALEANSVGDIPQLWGYLSHDLHQTPIVTTERLDTAKDNMVEKNITENVLLGIGGDGATHALRATAETLTEALEISRQSPSPTCMDETDTEELKTALHEARLGVVHMSASQALNKLDPEKHSRASSVRDLAAKIKGPADPMDDPMIAGSSPESMLYEETTREQDLDELSNQIETMRL